MFHFLWLDASVLLLKKKTQNWSNFIKATLKQQKYPIALTENDIKTALQIPLNELRKPNEKGTEEAIPFLSTQNPNNPNILVKTNIWKLSTL